jgi:hypothetical protein
MAATDQRRDVEILLANPEPFTLARFGPVMMSAIRSLSGRKRTFNETTGSTGTLPPHHWRFGDHTQFLQTLDRRPIKTRHALHGVAFVYLLD